MMRNPRRWRPSGTDPPALLGSRDAPTTAIVVAPDRISCEARAITMSNPDARRRYSASRTSASDGSAHLRHDGLGAVVQVGRGESQDVVAGFDERILAAVVADEAVAVIASVELDNQMSEREVEIGPSDECTVAGVEVSLDFGRW